MFSGCSFFIYQPGLNPGITTLEYFKAVIKNSLYL